MLVVSHLEREVEPFFRLVLCPGDKVLGDLSSLLHEEISGPGSVILLSPDAAHGDTSYSAFIFRHQMFERLAPVNGYCISLRVVRRRTVKWGVG